LKKESFISKKLKQLWGRC